MLLKEKYEKWTCEECDTYDYVFEIEIGDETEGSYSTRIRLCKKCLLKLLKLIIER